MTGDAINALFELGTAIAIARNICAFFADGVVKGVRASNTAFFLAWGIWNVWFYPHNGFVWSWLAGIAVVVANVAWLGLVWSSTWSIGTRSVIFGVHCFWLHPFFIAAAWWRLYGFPWDPRLWAAFFVHDLGYLGKPNMDGLEGETHPFLGARFMLTFFGEEWHDLVLFHSPYASKRMGKPVSRLCYADKMVFVIEPAWIYLPRVRLSGELAEFMDCAKHAPDADKHTPRERDDFASGDPKRWHRSVRSYMQRWLDEHKDGSPDTWTRLRHAPEAS